MMLPGDLCTLEFDSLWDTYERVTNEQTITMIDVTMQSDKCNSGHVSNLFWKER